MSDGSKEGTENSGTIILDATCAPQNISYPQDVNRLNGNHGINAAIVYLLHFYYYQKIIDYIIDKNKESLRSDSKGIKWLRMCFDIPDKSTNEKQKEYIIAKYKKEYKEIAAQVGYAILVHNLYPSCFNGGKGIMTNDMEKQLDNFQNILGQYLDSADEKIKVYFR